MCKMYMVLQLKFTGKIKLPLGHRLEAFSKLCSWCPVEFLESPINKKNGSKGYETVWTSRAKLFCKKLEISQNSQKNTCARVSF